MCPTRRTPHLVIQQLTQALGRLTAKQRPEDQVRARAEALLAYLADVPIAILVANDRSRYVDANRHAIALTGYSRGELTRMGLVDLTPHPNAAIGRRLWRAFLRRGRMAGRYELRRKNGSIIAAQYLAVANVLPGVHVSALVPVPIVRPRSTRSVETAKRRQHKPR